MVRLRDEANIEHCSITDTVNSMLHELAHRHYPEHVKHFYDFWSAPQSEFKDIVGAEMLTKTWSRPSHTSRADSIPQTTAQASVPAHELQSFGVSTIQNRLFLVSTMLPTHKCTRLALA